MQFKYLATISALTAVAVAQDISQVPKCAQAPALQAFGKTGCALTNIKCLCQSTALVPALEAAIEAACTPAEVAQVNQFAISTCAQAGVTLVIPGASGNTTTVSSTTSGTSSSSASSHSTTTSTTTNTISSSGMTSMSSTASAVLISTSSTGSTTGTATSATSSATGAANVLQVGGSALAGAVLFALAF